MWGVKVARNMISVHTTASSQKTVALVVFEDISKRKQKKRSDKKMTNMLQIHLVLSMSYFTLLLLQSTILKDSICRIDIFFYFTGMYAPLKRVLRSCCLSLKSKQKKVFFLIFFFLSDPLHPPY